MPDRPFHNSRRVLRNSGTSSDGFRTSKVVKRSVRCVLALSLSISIFGGKGQNPKQALWYMQVRLLIFCLLIHLLNNPASEGFFFKYLDEFQKANVILARQLFQLTNGAMIIYASKNASCFCFCCWESNIRRERERNWLNIKYVDEWMKSNFEMQNRMATKNQ